MAWIPEKPVNRISESCHQPFDINLMSLYVSAGQPAEKLLRWHIDNVYVYRGEWSCKGRMPWQSTA